MMMMMVMMVLMMETAVEAAGNGGREFERGARSGAVSGLFVLALASLPDGPRMALTLPLALSFDTGDGAGGRSISLSFCSGSGSGSGMVWHGLGCFHVRQKPRALLLAARASRIAKLGREMVELLDRVPPVRLVCKPKSHPPSSQLARAAVACYCKRAACALPVCVYLSVRLSVCLSGCLSVCLSSPVCANVTTQLPFARHHREYLHTAHTHPLLSLPTSACP